MVLAAGEGTRMRSERPKPLHQLCGRPMILHVLDALAERMRVPCPAASTTAESGRPGGSVREVPTAGSSHSSGEPWG